MVDLTGRAAVVTGASGGLGRALAIALARAGADVALLARRESALEDTALRVRAAGRRAVVCALDIRDPAAVAAAQAQVLRAMTPDILVNNAGQFVAGSLADLSSDALAGLLGTVVTGTALVTHAFWPSLLRAGPGYVVNIGARVAAPGRPGIARDTSVAYQTGKRAVAIFAEMLRQEAGSSVRVSTLYLPAIASLTDLDDGDREVARHYGNAPVLPLKRVADVVLELVGGRLTHVEELVLSP